MVREARTRRTGAPRCCRWYRNASKSRRGWWPRYIAAVLGLIGHERRIGDDRDRGQARGILHMLGRKDITDERRTWGTAGSAAGNWADRNGQLSRAGGAGEPTCGRVHERGSTVRVCITETIAPAVAAPGESGCWRRLTVGSGVRRRSSAGGMRWGCCSHFEGKAVVGVLAAFCDETPLAAVRARQL